MREVPEDVQIGLRNIKQTLHARWNPTARYLSGASFDVNGNPRKVTYDPRWEIWDTDESGREYRVTILDGRDGEFVDLGMWVVEMMNKLNPERYGGDLHKMIEALVDQPNLAVDKVGNDTYEELINFLADLCWSEHSRGSRVTVPSPMV